MSTPNHRASLVVAERGSAWDRWVAGVSEPGVLLQEQGEAPAVFAQRVRSHVAELEARGQMPGRVVLVGGRRREGALSARSLMIRAIAHGMVAGGGGELLLDGHGSDRFTMRALADTVSDMVRGSGLAVVHAQAEPATPMYQNVA
ncbi:MAG: hypothetical protein ACODAU_07125 [Myxococcota bacterium]